MFLEKNKKYMLGEGFMETTISIIIPVYNAFKHMEKCLEYIQMRK